MGNMGRQTVGLSVTGTVSRHNDERDDADDRAWEKFANEVRKVAEREEFADLNLWVSGGAA